MSCHQVGRNQTYRLQALEQNESLDLFIVFLSEIIGSLDIHLTHHYI